jgi:uroporphyrinogen decarboxylase
MAQDQHAIVSPPGHFTGRERMLRALAGKEVDRPPIWFMRQAGRYLPEYRAIRQEVPFEARLQDPALATKITLQPLQRFPLDAAILFSDILVPFTALGHPARFGSEGPRLASPLRTPEQVEAIDPAPPEQAYPYVTQALRQVRAALPDQAVLGFAGAPFTLAAYLIEGGGSKEFVETKSFAYRHPEAWDALLGKLADVVGDHLASQAAAGADAVQLFDTWAELLGPDEYERLALPWVQRAIKRCKDASSTPTIFFARGTAHLLPLLGATGADAYSVDWRVALPAVRDHYPGKPLQGNLDPTLLFAPPQVVARQTRRVLDSLRGEAHVFNLGHGILPTTPLESVYAMVEAVTSWKP